MKLILLAFIVALANAGLEKESSRGMFEARNVTFDKNARSTVCEACSEITITSTGGALEHQPQTLTT